VQIIPIGTDMSPLLAGQVDAIAGWQTNTTALKALGPERIDLRMVGRRRAPVCAALLRHRQDHPEPL